METLSAKTKIFIADTEESFASRCIPIFEEHGIEIVGCSFDAPNALEKIEKFRPRVVISEIYLESNDVFWLMAKTKEKLGDHSPRFIIVSRSGNRNMFEECSEFGAVYCMQKPVDYRLLAERICRISRNRQNGQGELLNGDLEEQVTTVIHRIGMPAHIKGYHYIRTSIIMAVHDNGVVDSITKTLYPSVAKMYYTTSSRVERAIRHAIEVAYARGNIDALNHFFCKNNQGDDYRPTNSEFIAQIADELRLKNKIHNEYKLGG